MGDFHRADYFLEPGVTIKQEVTDTNTYNTSASVPIPSKRIPDYHELSFDFESSQSSSYQDINVIGDLQLQSSEGGMMWSNRMGLEMELAKNEGLIHMDDDDIFQVVDKADLIQGPTLAELNANDETLLGDLNFDDLLLPEENSYNYVNIPAMQKMSSMQINNTIGMNTNRLNNNHTLTASSCPQTGIGFYRDNVDLCSPASTSPYNAFVTTKNNIAAFSPVSQNSSNSSLHTAPLLSSTVVSPIQQKHSTLHELLLKKETNDSSPDRTCKTVLGQSVPGPNSSVLVGSSVMRLSRSHISRLSSSAPTHLGMEEQIWQRREPRKHLHSTGSLAEAGSTSSLSTGGVLSPDPQDFSHDEFDSDEDSEHYEDFSSDNGMSDSDEEGDDHSSRGTSSPSKKERYFWQYNVQAKGPKGQRLVMKSKMEDPHILHEITDPVFSPDCAVRGIKHSGKARKGDGNDLTPNARKLYSIGKELDKLSRIINDMTPVSELPFNIRPKTRKEKNKLASRACRLKKKAQHEANKIKLQGLENEHKRLLNGIQQAKQIITAKISESSTENQEELTKHIDKVAKSAGKVKIAGHTTEYVNKVLDKLRNSAGGGASATSLDDLS